MVYLGYMGYTSYFCFKGYRGFEGYLGYMGLYGSLHLAWTTGQFWLCSEVYLFESPGQIPSQFPCYPKPSELDESPPRKALSHFHAMGPLREVALYSHCSEVSVCHSCPLLLSLLSPSEKFRKLLLFFASKLTNSWKWHRLVMFIKENGFLLFTLFSFLICSSDLFCI